MRGRGLLVGLDLVQDRATKAPAPELAQRVARACLELGMMTSVVRGGFGIFRIAPPITIGRRRSTWRSTSSTGHLPGPCTELSKFSPFRRGRVVFGFETRL